MFACGSSLYAVPSERAAEVVNLPALTRVPGAPGHVLGVFAHRGEVIPVVDLSRLLGGRGEDAYRRAVLVRAARGAVALTSSRVHGVSQLTGTFDRLGDAGVQRHLRGPAKAPAGDAAVVDPDGLLDFLVQGG